MPKVTLVQLRSQAKTAYNRGAGNKALKGYHQMPKAKLMALLGYRSATTSASGRFAHKATVDRISKYTGASDALGGREKVLKLVKSAVDKARRQAVKQGREASQQELRGAAFSLEF